MGLFDRLFHRKPANTTPATSLNGWWAMFPEGFGDNIYASDVVQQALKCIVDEMKKLKPQHVRTNDSYEPVPVKSTLQDVLDEPNELMTTSEFIEKTMWLLLMNYNAFIIPVYSQYRGKQGEVRRSYEGLYPILPTQVDFIQDASNRLFVTFTFGTGYKTTIPYDDVIHLKYNYSVNDYMGGNLAGQPDHQALLETLRLNDDLLKGVAKAMKASYAVNGIVRYNTLMDNGKTEQALREFERRLQNNESGFVPVDLKAEVTPYERKVALVDEPTLKFIDEKILRNWGVPLDILKGEYSKETYEAFYQKVLEPLALSMSQAFTKKLFTAREKAFGNRVEFYPKDLIFLSMGQTIEMINILSPTGALYENEKRTALGLRPLAELEGKRYMSLNWIDAADASQYQVGKVNVDVVDKEEQEEVTEE